MKEKVHGLRFLSEEDGKFYDEDKVYNLNGRNFFEPEVEYDETDPRFYEDDVEVIGDWFMDTGFLDLEDVTIWDLDIIFYEENYYIVQEDFDAQSLCFVFTEYPTVLHEKQESKKKPFTEEVAKNSIVVGNGLIETDIQRVLSNILLKA